MGRNRLFRRAGAVVASSQKFRPRVVLRAVFAPRWPPVRGLLYPLTNVLGMDNSVAVWARASGTPGAPVSPFAPLRVGSFRQHADSARSYPTDRAAQAHPTMPPRYARATMITPRICHFFWLVITGGDAQWVWGRPAASRAGAPVCRAFQSECSSPRSSRVGDGDAGTGPRSRSRTRASSRHRRSARRASGPSSRSMA